MYLYINSRLGWGKSIFLFYFNSISLSIIFYIFCEKSIENLNSGKSKGIVFSFYKKRGKNDCFALFFVTIFSPPLPLASSTSLTNADNIEVKKKEEENVEEQVNKSRSCNLCGLWVKCLMRGRVGVGVCGWLVFVGPRRCRSFWQWFDLKLPQTSAANNSESTKELYC